MGVWYIILLIIVVIAVMSILHGSIIGGIGATIALAGGIMAICGFIYGIYMTFETDIFSYSVFDTFKYLRLYGKECLIAHALFYGGIMLAVFGMSVRDEG